MSRPLALLAGLAIAVSGCASSGGATPEAGPVANGATAAAAADAPPTATASAPRRNSNRDVLTTEELTSSGSSNLYDVVVALRPRWLQNTSTTNIAVAGQTGYANTSGVGVYVDGQLFGDVKSMATIQKANVEQVRYLSVSEAQQRYGTRVFAPVIDVRLKGSRE